MKNKKTILLSFISLVLLSLVLVGFAYLMKDNPIIVDDFVNKNVQEIVDWQKANKIENDQIIYKFVFDENIEKDVIIKQSIAKDQTLKDVIEFEVSKGKDPTLEIDLIDFTTLTEDQIMDFFKQNGFTDYSVEYVSDAKIEKGKFIKINIEGKTAKRNDLILITISSGNDKQTIELAMPDFSKSSKNNIDAWAKENKITVKYEYAYSDKIEKGAIISFSPKAQTVIKSGSTINVTISNGKGISLIDLVGKSFDEASKWLNDNGIKFNRIEVYSEKTQNNVTFTDPKASSILASGSTISLYTSAGLVPVDNYVGKTKTNFASWLSSINAKYSNTAELKVNYIEEESASVAAGSIIKMTFNGNTYSSSNDAIKHAKPKDTITVTVSKGKSISVESKVGASEQDFIAYINGLGLKTSKGSSVYSSHAKDTIAKHQTGSFAANSTIGYQLSLGTYAPDANSFNGKSQNDITSTLNGANNLEAGGWSFSIISTEYNESVANGLTFECSISNKVVACKVSKGAKPLPVNVGAFDGQDEKAFLNYLNSNGLKAGNREEAYSDTILAGKIIKNDVGSFEQGTAINYTVSKGKAPATSAEIIDLGVKCVTGNPNASKDNIYNYLISRGFKSENINIQIIRNEVQPGLIITSPPSGIYSFDYVFEIIISGGNDWPQ